MCTIGFVYAMFLKDRKWRPEGGEGSRKISFETLGRCPKNHLQTRSERIVMSTTQMNGWMFPRNTAGHHKANGPRSTHTKSRI